jgi:hypothetical protein
MNKNIYQKILEVMKNIEYLSKDDAVAFGTTKYRAMSEEKVTMTVRKELIKQGLVVFPVEQTVEKDGHITTTNTTYKMVNTDNPEEFVFLASSGQGSDTQDKGVGKAMTYSFKYMLLRTFAIPTGEDPDKVASAQIDYEEALVKKKATLKKLLEETDSDVVAFLGWCTKTFERKVKSVDELKDLELDEAIRTVKRKEKK